MKKIVITGITGCRNRGVEALLQTTIQGLRRVCPEVPLAIWTDSVDYDSSVCTAPGIEWVDQRSSWRELALSRAPWVAGLVKSMPGVGNGYKRLRASIRGAGLVISSGGDIFGKDYGIYSMRKYLEPLQWAAEEGVPYVFCAQSIGPFKDAERRNLWLPVGRKAALITVRESVTREYLVKELGLPPEKVVLTADSAFLLSRDAEVGRKLRGLYEPLGDGPLLAVSISQGISKYAGLSADHHPNSWLKVLRLLRERLGARVILIPHVQEIRLDNDDRFMSTRLWRDLGFPDWIRIASGNHTAVEYKSLIGACDSVIAERMHAAIAGLSSAVPTMVVGYSPKGVGIIGEMFEDPQLRQQALISVEHLHSDPGHLVAAFCALWENRVAHATALSARASSSAALASMNFRRILGVL